MLFFSWWFMEEREGFFWLLEVRQCSHHTRRWCGRCAPDDPQQVLGQTAHSYPSHIHQSSTFSPADQLSLVHSHSTCLQLASFPSLSHYLFTPLHFAVSLKNPVNGFTSVLCLRWSSESWFKEQSASTAEVRHQPNKLSVLSIGTHQQQFGAK